MQEESQITTPKSEDFHILRLGYYDHANLLPLLYPLDAGWAAPPSPWKLEIVKALPAELEQKMQDGELDAAFLTPFSIARESSNLGPVGAWGLAIEGRTETALLLSPQRLDLMDQQDVSISPEARLSTAHYLLKLLLKPYYDITLNVKTEGEPGYDKQGTRLLYGDRAAREAASKPGNWVAEDLGVAWYVLSGLPLVWELLAAPRDLETRKPGATGQLQEMMRLSQRMAQEQAASVLDAAEKRTGLAHAQIKEQFARQRYTLTDRDRKGLAHFLDLTSRAGIMPR